MTDALELHDLKMHHPTPAGLLKAVDGISFKVARSETLGLVGESGCGKSTLARCVVGLNRPTAGAVVLGGREVGHERADRLNRAKRVQMVFQDPMSALNPRLTIRKAIEQPLDVHRVGNRASRRARTEALMAQVGLGAHLLDRFPHELSGGQRQRVCIARALTLEPDLIVCDEAVSALDVSVQAQVLNLMTDLQQRLGVALLFISHDLAVIRYISHRIAVMYLGRIVEIGESESVWHTPQHPYAQALIASIPGEGPDGAAGPALSGDVPSPINTPSGCAFRSRCPRAQAICAEVRPELSTTGRPHAVACHFPG